MKIKKVFIVLPILLLAVELEAQFNTGIFAGPGIGAVRLENLGRNDDQNIEGNNISAVELGVFFQSYHDLFYYDKFYLKTALAYNYAQGTLNTAAEDRFTLQKIQVPFLAGAMFHGPFFVEAGGTYNYLFNATKNIEGFPQAKFGSHGLGYRVGAGFDFDRVILGLHYQGISYETPRNADGLRELYKFSLSAGFKFIPPKKNGRIKIKKE